MSVAALLVAAGRGRRFGAPLPKQYVPLAGPCALRRSTEAFLALGEIHHVLPVIHGDDSDLAAEALSGLVDTRLLPPVIGGDTRALSVRRGLEALEVHTPARVLIHDAARPFVPGPVIQSVIDALDETPGACAALPVVDALWQAEGGLASVPVPRDGLWRAQTPQGFDFKSILSAHRSHDGSGADDVAVAREAGLDVTFVEGSEQGFKITTAADLDRALAHVAATAS